MSRDNGPESIPIAIIGMGCRLPGAADLDEFWKLISEGRSAVREMPDDRMDRSLYFDPRKGVRGKTYSTLAATLDSREFDRDACPIPEELVRGVDNAHLLMCGVAAEALRNAGIDPFNVPLRNTGVYVGHAQGSELGCDYTYATCVGEAAEFLREMPAFQQLPPSEQDGIIQSLVAEVRSRLPHRTPDSPDVSACMVAGTISKAFGLSGPFLAINSACASSLQAMLLGARALQLGHVDMAVVGGASDCKGDSLVLFAHAQAMSSTGSRPFDADADGLIVGEGYVAVVMKRLDRALADGDNVLAVVRGLGISSDGKGKSLWAPRKEGQIKAMERAYRAGIDLSGLQYVEAHSTATQLGDATELNTLAEVLAPHFPPGHKIPVTSVKANIGHTLESAGLAGVIKTILCMQRGIIPAATNINNLNPNIDWDNSPVYVPLAETPWPAPANGQPRRAGVNAFGIGGLNMHVVLEEYRGSEVGEPDVGNSRLAATQQGAWRSVAPPSPPADAIAVIGRGCIFPGAANLDGYWRLLQSGADPKTDVPAGRWRSDLAFKPNSREAFMTPSTLGGYITDYEHDWRRHKIPPRQIQQADPLQFMLLDAMDEALAEAGLDQKDFDRSRVGVVVGTEFGGDFAFQLQLGLRIPELSLILRRLLTERGLDAEQTETAVEQYAETMLAHWPALIDETGSFSTSTLASRLGKTWNFMGGAAAIDAGDASSLSALAIAADMLRAHDCDMMVCAGGQRRMGLPEYETLSLKGLLPTDQPQSPLDANGNGYVPGEGVGVVILKRLADAQRDGDPIHSIIRSVAAGHAHDAAESTRLAIQRSTSMSGVAANDLSVIELDATGSAHATGQQLSAIAQSQEPTERKHPLLVSSVASQIGHTQGAAGITSLLKASLEVSHGVVPKTHGVSQPSPELVEHSNPFHVSDGRRLPTDTSTAAAVVSYSRGMVYQAIIEQAVAASRSNEHVEQPQSAITITRHDMDSASAPNVSTADLADLEAFLINFVVEQTGYPPEVVELDADLEADLGIDSIKKAQLFGELQEYFDVTPTEGLTLDDFPTLRHIVRFLAEFSTPSAAYTNGDVPSTKDQDSVGGRGSRRAEPADVDLPTTAQQELRPPVLAQSQTGNHTSDVHRPVAAQRELRPPVDTQTSDGTHGNTAAEQPDVGSIEDLQTFLINFVVEQTGYPPEVVELDADLEADLGIDSIKKAQLFGELQEYFDVTPTGDVTLDDFPTLRHVVNFLATNASPVGRDTSHVTPVTAAPESPATTAATSRVAPSKPETNRQDGPWRIVRIAGASWDDLRSQLSAGQKRSESLFQSAVAGRRFARADRFRAAIVADSPEALARKLEQASAAIDQPSARRPLENQGIFLREVGKVRPRIAFVFPGQGSQYAGMLRPLVQQCPNVAAELNKTDATLEQLGENSFAEIAWSDDGSLGIDVWSTQLAMLLADSLMFSNLKQRGITPDVVLGHSYGEYAALVAAESWTLAEAIRVTQARCEGIEGSLTSHGGMLATNAPVDELERLISQTSGDLYIANLNAPDQTVVGGRRPALRELERLLKASSHQSRLLPVPCAFHTPLMQDAVPPLAESLRQAEISAPRVATYSVANNHLVTSADQVRENLIAHMTQPVKYLDLIRQVATEAPTVFVEVGPQQALTRLNARILNDSLPDLIASDCPKRPGIEQLLAVEALLDVCGASDPAEVKSETRMPVSANAPAEIIHFDATARRREKMRQSAARKGGSTVESTGETVSPVATVSSGHNQGASNGATKSGLPLPPRIPASPPSPSPSAAPQPMTAARASAAVLSAPQGPAATSESTTAVYDAGDNPDTSDLESFLINFVVEQTGYPPEVVELDADLEADLGIDSIKKAQLFGELQEYFDVKPTEGLTLDDFPTLRHVVRFLAASTESSGELPSPLPTESSIERSDFQTTDTNKPEPADSSNQLPSSVDVPVVHLRGTAYEIGREHGAALREPIRRALRRIADLSGGQANELPIDREVVAYPDRHLPGDVLDELRGIADGAGVSLGSVLAWNLILLAELGMSATHVVVSGGCSATGSPLHGMRDDLCLMGALTDCLTPIVQVREKTGAIPLAAVTFAGFAGSLAGISAHRLTVSGFASETPTRDDRVPGRHLLLVSQILEAAADQDSAVDQLTTATSGRWQFCVTQPGSEGPVIIRRDEKGVKVSRCADIAIVHAHATSAADRAATEVGGTGHTFSVSRLAIDLSQFGSSHGRNCIVVLNPDASDLHVGIGDGHSAPQLRQIDVAAFLGSVAATSVSKAGSGSAVASSADGPAYDLPEVDSTSQRFVMTMVPAPLPPDSSATWTANGPALIVGENPVAEALQHRLTSAGVGVHRLASQNLEDAIAELERLWAVQKVSHLFLTSAHDDVSGDLTDVIVWERVRDQQVMLPYFLCQRWLQLAHDAKCIDGCSVVAVTSLGGDFGFASNVASPQSGGLTGLMKALCLEYFVLREHQEFLAKAIDGPRDEDPTVLADCIYAELASKALDYEVAFVNGERFLQLASHRSARVQ